MCCVAWKSGSKPLYENEQEKKDSEETVDISYRVERDGKESTLLFFFFFERLFCDWSIFKKTNKLSKINIETKPLYPSSLTNTEKKNKNLLSLGKYVEASTIEGLL